MTLKTDIQNDYLLFDGVETVTLSRQHPAAANVEGVKALRRQLSINQMAYLGGGAAGIDTDGTVFHLFEVTMGGAKVDDGDLIVDADGTSYSVHAVSYSPQTSRYRCVCARVR